MWATELVWILISYVEVSVVLDMDNVHWIKLILYIYIYIMI
jgi:hypothetical protein